MSDPPPTDLQRTLFAAAGGDEEAWRILVDAYAKRVFVLLRSQCGDSELAEEITQSTFCTVASKLRDYAELGRFEAWLFRIAMNRLRDEMRRQKRHAISVEPEALTGLVGAGGSEAEPTDPAEIAALRRAMSRLSDADREVIHLRHFGGMSFRQIAELLEEPLGTVLARQHRALQKLADLVQESKPGEKAKAGEEPPPGRHSFSSETRQ